jgi:hypothetical protein
MKAMKAMQATVALLAGMLPTGEAGRRVTAESASKCHSWGLLAEPAHGSRR